VSIAVASVGLAPGAFAQVTSVTAQPPQIVTSGSGEARVSPDRATIVLGVESKASSASAAAADNARRQRSVIDTLRALGLSSAQLATVNYRVSPDLQYNQSTGTPRVVGYTVSNSVRADIRRLDDVSRVIDAALAKGANEISSLEFYSTQADSARRVALAVAVANARADAEAMARAAGGSLGPLLELSSAGVPIRPFNQVAMARVAAGPVPTPIEAGDQTVSVTVSARWAFVSNR
jgi:uncharacterized protein YggE